MIKLNAVFQRHLFFYPMYRLALLILLVIQATNPLFAQHLEGEIDYRPAKDEEIQVFPSPLGLTLLFCNGYNLRCFFLNENLQVLRRTEATLGQAYIGRSRLGALDLGDRLFVIFEEGNAHYAVAMHKFSGQVEEYALPLEAKGKDRWLNSLNAEGTLLILKQVKKSGALRVYLFGGEEDLRLQEYSLASPAFAAQLEAFQNGKLPASYFPGQEPETQAFASVKGDKLYLVVGQEAEIINWEKGEKQLVQLSAGEREAFEEAPSGLVQKGEIHFEWKGMALDGSYDAEKKSFVIRSRQD